MFFFPSPVFAATGEGNSWGWVETIGRWFNLSLLFGVIFYYARGPIGRFFQQRKKGIAEEMEAARSARVEAEKKLAEIEQRMNRLDSELEAIRIESRNQAERERNRIIEQAEEEARKLVAAAEREIGGLTRAAEQDLRQYVTDLSVSLAGERIRQELDAETESRMMDRFFSELAGAGK